MPRADLRVRHSAVRVVGDELQLFYTQRGDSPERVLLSTIDLSVPFEDWTMSYPGEEILQAEPGWEGGQFPAEPSETASAPEDVNQLRDPGIFEDSDGSVYLIYTGRGEDALGLVLLQSPFLIGDMNDDGVVSFLDISSFILALSDPSAYETMLGIDPNIRGDANADGVIDFLDISGFITLLSGN